MKRVKHQANFIQDFKTQDIVHVRCLRSKIAKGAVKSIQAPALPRDYHLIRPSDIPGRGYMSVFETQIPILASNDISYPGEVIALLCGPDPALLEQLEAGVQVEYEEEWPLFSFESFSSDQIIHKRLIVKGDVETSFDTCQSVVERNYRTGSQEHYYPEPQGAFVEFDYDKLCVHSSTQWPFHVRENVAKALSIKEEDVTVMSVSAGAHLDGKLWYPSLIAIYACLGALVSKRPARLLLSRYEDFSFSPKRSRFAISMKAGLSKDGQLEALDTQIIMDMGAHAPLAREMLDRICASALGGYRCPAVRIQGYSVRTNTIPLGACAGFGMSSLFFALECLISEIIEGLETEPLAWRKRQLAVKGESLLTGATIKETPPYEELAQLAIEGSDYPRKFSSYELLRKRGIGRRDGPLRGIGFAFAFQGNGFLSSSEDRETYSVECCLEKNLKMFIRTSAVPTTPGTIELWRGMANSILDLPPDSIRLIHDSTATCPNSGPSTLSRNITIVTSLVKNCLESIQSRRFRDTLPITVHKSFKVPKAQAWDADTFTGVPFASLSYGAAVVEVEISGESLEPRVKEVWLAIDAGQVVSPQRAQNATENAVITALSWASRERLDLADGRVPNYVFQRYTIPDSRDIPPISVKFLPAGSKDKARGIGELPYHLIPAAYARALAQATGMTLTSIPVNIDSIIQEVGPQ